MKKTLLKTESHIPQRSALPAIDAHNHLWGEWDVDRVLSTLDAVGVEAYCDVTANVKIAFAEGGYTVGSGNIDEFFQECAARSPGRFYCFTMAEFARPAGSPLYRDAGEFADLCIDTLRRHVQKGARGLKVLKELGLKHRDADGNLINVNDDGLAEIWEEAGRLGVPVLIHQADPTGFFEPVEPENEHVGSLRKFPDWSFSNPKYPRKPELLARRDDLVRRHPNTTFILPHVANSAEDLGSVTALLESCPNVYIDFSARIDELGRQPYSARRLFVDYQDRILFGTDMPANIEQSIDMYRCYFRFLETYDEGFYPPDYDGTFDRARWPICGIGLPREVLKKVYRDNALRIIPGLRDQLRESL